VPAGSIRTALLAFLALVVIAERTLFWVAGKIRVKLKG
jgi:hypothetical protein